MAIWTRLLGLERTEREILSDLDAKGKQVYSSYQSFEKFSKGVYQKLKKSDKAKASEFRLFLDAVENSVKPILRAETRFMKVQRGDVHGLEERRRDSDKTQNELRILRKLFENSEYGDSIKQRGRKIVDAAAALSKVEDEEISIMNHA